MLHPPTHAVSTTCFQENAQNMGCLVKYVDTVDDILCHLIDQLKRIDRNSPSMFCRHSAIPEDVWTRHHGTEHVERIDSHLRERVHGLDLAVTGCLGALADTGTLILDDADPDTRMASMIADIHVVLLHPGKILLSRDDLASQLANRMASGPAFEAWITGPSRTADIERVLAIGVHGPKELHVLMGGCC